MSDATPAKRFEGIWSGYAQGTNRGKMLLRIKRSANTANGLTAKAILYDEQLGITQAWLSGLISGGDKAEFRLLDVRGLAPFVPREGGVVLNLKEDGTAEGQWQTDIGTAGVFRISRANFDTLGWYWRILCAKASFAWHKWLAPVYGLFLVVLAVISIFFNTNISYPALILLLVPVPFVFRSQLTNLIGMIQAARIRRLGFIEFEQNPPTAEIVAVATQQVQENIVFSHLNQFFVARTKILLTAVARSNEGLSIAEFRNLALSFGAAPENVDVTLSAIQQANCARIENERVLLTDLGERCSVRFARLARRFAGLLTEGGNRATTS
jgi:hypothetical protein